MPKDNHQLAPTPVRLAEDLKLVLKAEAQANERSLNGEIVARLKASLTKNQKGGAATT